MDSKGDLPDRKDVQLDSTPISTAARAKVEAVADVLNNGGVAHVYLDSVEGGDLHLYSYNTYCFSETGWIFNHADDEDMWIPGDNIGAIERHYEK